MAVSQVRQLLWPQNPFVFGKYPERPAPSHVMNGFISSSLGISNHSNSIRQLVVPNAPVPVGIPVLNRADWAQDEGKLRMFRKDLSLIFNPDSRVWEKFGSLVPVHNCLANLDASDDGLGQRLCEMVRLYTPPEYEQKLSQMFLPDNPHDPVTACAMILVDGARPSPRRSSQLADSSWCGSGGTQAGQLLAKHLTMFLVNLTEPYPDARRLLQIQHLERGLYFATFLALLLGPLAGQKKDVTTTVDQIGALVIWSDTPPGPASHPLVSASGRAFQLLLDQNRAALIQTLAEALGKQLLPSSLPQNQRRLSALQSQMSIMRTTGTEESTVTAIEHLCQDAQVSKEGDNPGDVNWCSQVIDNAYPAAALTRGFKRRLYNNLCKWQNPLTREFRRRTPCRFDVN